MSPLILASTSPARAALLRNAGLEFETVPPRVDEASLRDSLIAEHASPRDIADCLAEQKARKVSLRYPTAMVLGCDQVLADGDVLMSKPETVSAARAQLEQLRGKSHRLLSAAVICSDGKTLWKHVDTARLTMRSFSDAYLDAYLSRCWPAVSGSVGAYQVEGEGIRLFSRIEGSYFTILGLPLLPLLGYLTVRGDIDG